MTEDPGSAAPGWYPITGAADGAPREVGFWDGKAWTGAKQPAGIGGVRPQDEMGRLALILLIVGIAGTVGIPAAFSALRLPEAALTFAMLVDLALTPIALVLSVLGLVRGFQQKFQTPLSLAVLIVSTLGTFFIVLPMGLFITGVWVLPHF